MFIANHNHTVLINIDHIHSIFLEALRLEQNEWRVAAYYNKCGSATLYRGTKEECENYLRSFYNQHS